MDETKLIRIALTILLSCSVSSCGLWPTVKERPKPAPTGTPVAASPEAVKKSTNVSFNTHSKEWPVNWQWIDPDFKYLPTGRDISSGVLTLTVPQSKDLTDQVRTAPRFIKAISGDFEIETRVKFRPTENFHGSGLLIYKDDLNYLRFLHAFGGKGGGGAGMFLDVWKNGEQEIVTTTADIQTESSSIDLRLIRSGRYVIAFWRLGEESEWREAGSAALDLSDTVFTGILACNTARESATVSFPYIRLHPLTK